MNKHSICFYVTVIGKDPLRDLVVSFGGIGYMDTPYGLGMIPQWQHHYELLSQYRQAERDLITPAFEVPPGGLNAWAVSQGLNGRTDEIIRVKPFRDTLTWRVVVIKVAKWNQYAMKYTVLKREASANLPQDERRRPLLPFSASDFPNRH